MADKVKSFYDRIAFAYPVLDLFLGGPKKRLLSRINEEPKGVLLEIGVGRGDNLPHYKHSPVTGIDLSEGMLAFARQKAPADCTILYMDASKLEFPDESFDYCVLSYVLSVVPDAKQVMDEVHRVLKPGGRVFILNHDSSGREKLNKILGHFSKFLHFSAVFEVESAIDYGKFNKVQRAEYGFMPRITMFVLDKI